MKLTEQKLKTLTFDWRNIAGEDIEVKQIKGAVYAYGSELATLRLLKHFKRSNRARQDYSVNLYTFFFSLEL